MDDVRKEGNWPDDRFRWHSRGYLPHCDVVEGVQSITFRLADAIPAEALRRMKQQYGVMGAGTPLNALPEPARTVEARKRTQLRRSLEKFSDAGHGSCILERPECAFVVEQSLLHFDDERYRLLAWSVMPTHVHVLIEVIGRTPVGKIVQSWKRHTAREIKGVLAPSPAMLEPYAEGKPVWQPDYRDRFVRDREHLAKVVEYIENNPVKAGLVCSASDWRFGSSWWRSQE